MTSIEGFYVRIRRLLSLAVMASVTTGFSVALCTVPALAQPVATSARAAVASPTTALANMHFMIKYRAGTAEARDVASANRVISQAMMRARTSQGQRSVVPSAPASTVNAALLRRMGMPGWSVVKASRSLSAAEELAFIRELKANPAVEHVERDELMFPTATARAVALPNDPDIARYQWNLTDPRYGVHAPEGWAFSKGEGVVVAVLDSGVAKGNPDLQANVLPGYDMVSLKVLSRRNTDGRVPGGWDVGNWVEENYCTPLTGEFHAAERSNWHGTHVAGTVAQLTNNGKGVAGVAPLAKIVPVRVLGSCGGLTSDIADGIVWAVGGEVPGLPINPNPAEIVNMSLGRPGSPDCPRAYQDALDLANDKGSIVVVSAGNAGASARSQTMGSCEGVLVVAASTVEGERSFFSNRGWPTVLAAPGGNEVGRGSVSGKITPFIWQVINGGARGLEPNNWMLEGYAGTSMATPHVSAAAAMIQSVAKKPLNLREMSVLLQRTASPFSKSPIPVPIFPLPEGITAEEIFGIGPGILNVEAALKELVNPTCDLEKPSCVDRCDPVVANCGPGTAAVVLVNKRAVVVQGERRSESLFSFQARAGGVLTFMSYGGTGDISMYVSHGKNPTIATAEARSTRGKTNIETVRVVAPKAGTYYIRLAATYMEGYQGVTLVARQQ